MPSGPQNADAKGVAVRVGLGDRVGAGVAARARLILDHERLPEFVLQIVGQHAADDIGRRAGRERHDEFDASWSASPAPAPERDCKNCQQNGEPVILFI